LAWATASGYREGLNPARWDTHLKQVYAAPELVKKQRRAKEGKSAHHASLDYREMGAFMALLRQETSIQARCLELIVLTSVRASEATQAKWDQFNLEEKYWRIPGVKMKAGQDHIVPLSEQTIRMIKALPRLDDEFLFPSPHKQRKGKHNSISDNSVLILAKRLKAGITVHGFRSTMMVWAAEKTQYPREIRELALAHTENNKTVAAYLHTDMYKKREALMKDWNNFCYLPPGHKATVTGINERASV
jgi:integrase